MQGGLIHHIDVERRKNCAENNITENINIGAFANEHINDSTGQKNENVGESIELNGEVLKKSSSKDYKIEK